MDEFCTSIHCMDGRIQEPVIRFLKARYQVKYVDVITEPGPCRILAENRDKELVKSIVERINISVMKHKSQLIAVSGHHDCAGNPCDADTQKNQIKKSIDFCRDLYPNIDMIGLWIDNNWEVTVFAEDVQARPAGPDIK